MKFDYIELSEEEEEGVSDLNIIFFSAEQFSSPFFSFSFCFAIEAWQIILDEFSAFSIVDLISYTALI